MYMRGWPIGVLVVLPVFLCVMCCLPVGPARCWFLHVGCCMLACLLAVPFCPVLCAVHLPACGLLVCHLMGFPPACQRRYLCPYFVHCVPIRLPHGCLFRLFGIRPACFNYVLLAPAAPLSSQGATCTCSASEAAGLPGLWSLVCWSLHGGGFAGCL